MYDGIVCREYGAKNILICSVMPRNIPYMQHRRRDLNKLLKDLCMANNFIFIDNGDIVLKDHIIKDGVHLNDEGKEILADNV